MNSNLNDLIGVKEFDPKEFLVIYRITRNNGTTEDMLYLPLRAAHEWFLLRHPDGQVLSTVDRIYMRDGKERVVCHATVSYGGQAVTDAYGEAEDSEKGSANARAAKIAKRAALALAGFGVPHDAVINDNIPILEIVSEEQLPDGSKEAAVKIQKPEKPESKEKTDVVSAQPEHSEATEKKPRGRRRKSPVEGKDKKPETAKNDTVTAKVEMNDSTDTAKGETIDSTDDAETTETAKGEANDSIVVIPSGKYKGLTMEEVYRHVCAEYETAQKEGRKAFSPIQIIQTFANNAFYSEDIRKAAEKILLELENRGE